MASRRRPRSLSVCCEAGRKGDHNPKTDLHPFNIPAFVLVHPVAPREERWQLEEDADKVNLWFEVPGQSKDDLTVEIDEDVLVIKKRKELVGQRSPAGGGVAEYGSQSQQQSRRGTADGKELPAAQQGQAGEVVYARMLLPAGYSRDGVQAELKSGVLRVTVVKVTERARRKIDVPIQVK